MSYEFEEKVLYITKYGFSLKFTYFVEVKWFYNDTCRIKIKTFNNKKIIYETVISGHKYDLEIDLIKNQISIGKYLDKFVKDYGKCIGCKQINDENCKWLYDEHGLFCSFECQKKPFADKCTICSKDISRRFQKVCPDKCSIECLVQDFLLKKTFLSLDVILYITKML